MKINNVGSNSFINFAQNFLNGKRSSISNFFTVRPR